MAASDSDGTDDLPSPRPGILDIAPYVGGESGLSGTGRVIRLASNEAAIGPSPKAVIAYQKVSATLDRYPDGGSLALREAIGEVHGLDPARIVCGAGSDELLQLLAKAYAGPGDEVVHSAHGFAMYPIVAKSVGAAPVSVPERDMTADVDALLAAVTDRTRIVFLANPNNPTGTYLSAADVRRLHAGLPGNCLLVLDAAYAEYVARDDYEDGAALAGEAGNVVMTRTFSKIYGLAALRLGWCYGPPAVVDVLNRIRGPFNVSAPAQAAGAAAIRDREHVARAREQAQRAMARFKQRVRGLGLEAPDSVGNFLLVGFPDGPGRDCKAAYDFLVQRRILVRRVAGYGLPRFLRVGMGLDADMTTVGDALEAFCKETG